MHRRKYPFCASLAFLPDSDRGPRRRGGNVRCVLHSLLHYPRRRPPRQTQREEEQVSRLRKYVTVYLWRVACENGRPEFFRTEKEARDSAYGCCTVVRVKAKERVNK